MLAVTATDIDFVRRKRGSALGGLVLLLAGGCAAAWSLGNYLDATQDVALLDEKINKFNKLQK